MRNGSNIQGLRKADRIRAKLRKILARHTPPLPEGSAEKIEAIQREVEDRESQR